MSSPRPTAPRAASPDEARLSRRQVLQLAVATVPWVVGLNAPRVLSAAEAADPPDIVLVVLDALRAATLPMYGHPRDTAPFLAILARHSTVFKQCSSTALWTRPAVNGLLTGLWPIEHGQWRLGRRIPAELPTFPRVLSRHGYRTALFTANSAIGEKYGLEGHFDHFSDRAAVERDSGSWLTRECELWGSAQSDGPLFVWAHYLPPHGPYDPPTRFLDEMLAQGPASADFLPPHSRDVDVSLESAVFGRIPWYQAKVSFSTDPRHYIARYEANVRYADALAGDLFARWQALGRKRRTLFIVTSDHGECMGEHGLYFAHGRLLHDSILHVPLLVHDSADPTGRVVEDAVSHVDLTATVLDWAGTGERLGRGVSLARGVPAAAEHLVVGQDYAKSGESGWALTQGRWRLVYNDCPRWGNAHVLDVRAGVRRRSDFARVPLPLPPTALAEPVELAPGVSLASLALHATTAESGEAIEYSGAVRLAPGRTGRLELRQRIATDPSLDSAAVLAHPCAGPTVALAGAATAPASAAGRPVEAIWEARFTVEGAAADASPWRRLFSFPVARKQELGPGLALVGAALEPAVARPGERVAVRTAWRLTQPPIAGQAVRLELVAPDGTPVRARGATRAREGVVAVLADVAGVPEASAHHGLRLLDTTWITVPARAPAGEYRVVARTGSVRGASFSASAEKLRAPDLAEGAAESEAGGAGDAAPGELAIAPLEVVDSASRAVVRLVERDAGFASFRALSALPEDFDPAVASSLEVLVERFPSEGHPLYLLASRATDPEARRVLLGRCLDRVPYHRAACAAARRDGDERARAALPRISPALPLDYAFDERVRLYGATLRRAPDGADGLYLSLYWEALAPIGETLEAFLQVRSTSERKSHVNRLSYLLGQGIRPNHAWRVGECVVDVLHLPLPPGRERVSIDLTLRPGWRYQEEGEDPIVLMARHSSGAARTRVLVASAPLAELPRARRDLLRAKRRDPIHYRLYDVAADPSEARDRLDDEPEVFRSLHAALLPLLERKWSAIAEGADAEVPAATRERLRAMGYAE